MEYYNKNDNGKCNSEYANKCIECTVTQCANHSCEANYCALSAIRVGTHESDPTKVPCTDCQSFEYKG